jgi:hypothetical protein
MSEALDSVKKEIAQLTEVIKSAGNDKATLDYDKLAEAVLKAQATQAADKPVRRGEGVDVGEQSETIKGGKFDYSTKHLTNSTPRNRSPKKRNSESWSIRSWSNWLIPKALLSCRSHAKT